MIKRFKNNIKRFQSLITRSQSDLKFTNQDVFLVSYPRSGNTWVRFLIANILKPSGVQIDFHNVHEFVPEIGRNNDIIQNLASPRIVKSHDLYNTVFPKVIYLVRDGRDVYVSYYYYKLKQLAEGTTFSDFLRLENVYPSTWSQHLRSWLDDPRPQHNLLMVRYEDLLENAETVLLRMMDFVGITVSPDTIRDAIENSKFDKMRKIDQTKGRKYKPTGSDEFVRKGKAGTWQKEFSDSDKDYFKKVAGDLLVKLGYEDDLSW
jgi:hypothetical protein